MFKDMADKSNISMPKVTQVEDIFDVSTDHIKLLIFFYLSFNLSSIIL